jgi:hypothetical protein
MVIFPWESVLVWLLPTTLAQRPLNLDFEKSDVSGTNRPWGWTTGWTPFTAGSPATFLLDSAVMHQGKRSLRISLPSTAVPGPQSLVLQVPSPEFLRREVTLTAWLRSKDVRRRAFLSLETWGDRKVTRGDTAKVAGTTDWTRHELKISVDSEAHSLVIIAAVDGPGGLVRSLGSQRGWQTHRGPGHGREPDSRPARGDRGALLAPPHLRRPASGNHRAG